jgi:hypothetical protein
MIKTLGFGMLGLAVGLAALSLVPRGPEADAPVAAAGRDARPPPAPRREPVPVPSSAAPPERAAVGRADREASLARVADEPLPAEPVTSAPQAAEAQRLRVDSLIAAGFGHARAEQIARSESELRLAAVRDELAATGTVQPLTGAALLAAAEQLRARLGDDDYERYLEATGRPTRVVVGSVEPESGAANAGLMPDDRIVAYAGRRVFSARELNALTLQSSSGSTVPVTVERDGLALQLYVAGGPLGVAPRAR